MGTSPLTTRSAGHPSDPRSAAETGGEPPVSSGQGPATGAAADATALRSLAQIAVFAALIGALGLLGAVPVPGLVPITAQTLGVMLAGAILGPWRGAASVGLLLVLVAFGMPLLSGGRGGLGVFVGPSVGYLLGWLAGAAIVGLFVHGPRRRDAEGRRRPVRPTWPRTILGTVAGGILAIYAVGIPLQALITGLAVPEAALASLAFLPGDLIKVAVACVVTMTLFRAYPRAFR
jgi:biotin transport system substrate-specific component